MPEQTVVTNHYTHGKLIDAIRIGVEKLGKIIELVQIDDLGPVDEFHNGGGSPARLSWISSTLAATSMCLMLVAAWVVVVDLQHRDTGAG